MSADPMRILYAAYIRLPTEKAHGTQIVHTAAALASAGCEVVLAIPGRASVAGQDPFSYYAVAPNFRLETLGTPDLLRVGRFGFIFSNIFFALQVAARALRARPNVVYTRDRITACILSLFFPFVVWEVHGEESKATVGFLKNRVHAVCITAGVQAMLAEAGMSQGRMVVAHDGVDLAAFANPESREAARTRLGLSQDAKIAMYIGRLDGWKGADTLLEASKLLPPGIEVAVIGGEEAQIAAYAKMYPQVAFLGYHEYREVADNQAAANVLVLPNTARDKTSRLFTSPLKLFTYMASGRPIVASDLPSLREVISEETAFLVAPDNAQALAAGVMQALDVSGESERRAAAARREVEIYTWEVRAQTILQFLYVQKNHEQTAR